MPLQTRKFGPLLGLALALALAVPAAAGLEDSVGRSEVRVYSSTFTLPEGGTVAGTRLPERLERLGYRRVHRRPARPGEYFWGHEKFLLYRQAVDFPIFQQEAELLALRLERGSGRVLGAWEAASERSWPLVLEPELHSESLREVRAPRHPLLFQQMPEHLWRALLAAEDHRFFEHSGLDAKGIARAMLKNARAGRVVQGGSTITQQLIKTRDLTAKRTLGRKVSEALRALELEAEADKEEILQAYLNSVYFGHVDGVSLYGVGAAARAFFGKTPEQLDLGEAALLAGLVQGPNGLSPIRHPQRAVKRQRWVLDRLEELEWAPKEEIEKARRRGLPKVRSRAPKPQGNRQLLAWVAEIVDRQAPGRGDEGKGILVETTVDPWLQAAAEEAVTRRLDELRRQVRGLRRKPLSAALLALDGETGRVLASVGGDPSDPSDLFDRVRSARRQPGSAVKPFVVLEAFEDCGPREPVYPTRLILDRALEIPRPGGPWVPKNNDGRFRGEVTVRDALVQSLNVPLVRLARWCGFEATAERFRRAGLELPEDAPPAFVLGATETSPLKLAGAYSVFSTLGERVDPLPVARLARPGGRALTRLKADRKRVSEASSAYLVRGLLQEVVERGTGSKAALEGAEAWGKTGTTSDLKDAWFVGGAGSLVTVVWVGVDDGSPLGLAGSTAALPLWRAFMEQAVGGYPSEPPRRPRTLVERWVDEDSGLRVRSSRRGAHLELFRRGVEPPKRRLLRPDHPDPAIR